MWSCSSIIFKTVTSPPQLCVNELSGSGACHCHLCRSGPSPSPQPPRGEPSIRKEPGADGLTARSGHPLRPAPGTALAGGREAQDLLLKSHLQVSF